MGWSLHEIEAIRADETETFASMRYLQAKGYIAEPHAAVAAHALKQSLKKDEHGVFLATAHPAKFMEAVEKQLQVNLPLPPELYSVSNKPVLSRKMAADSDCLREFLLTISD
jgi:threonine synthase